MRWIIQNLLMCCILVSLVVSTMVTVSAGAVLQRPLRVAYTEGDDIYVQTFPEGDKRFLVEANQADCLWWASDTELTYRYIPETSDSQPYRFGKTDIENGTTAVY